VFSGLFIAEGTDGVETSGQDEKQQLIHRQSWRPFQTSVSFPEEIFLEKMY
jgi:hypothetical protein